MSKQRFILSPSSRKDKKWMVKRQPNNTYHTHFGDPNYSDFTFHHDKGRQQNYLARHGGGTRETWQYENGKDTAGFWSRWLLWEKPDLFEAMQNMEKQYPMEICCEDEQGTESCNHKECMQIFERNPKYLEIKKNIVKINK